MEKSLGVPDDFALAFHFEWTGTEELASAKLGPKGYLQLLADLNFCVQRSAKAGLYVAKKTEIDHAITWRLSPIDLEVKVRVRFNDEYGIRRYKKNAMADVAIFREVMVKRFLEGDDGDPPTSSGIGNDGDDGLGGASAGSALGVMFG